MGRSFPIARIRRSPPGGVSCLAGNTPLGEHWRAVRDRFIEAFHMATLAMAAHRMRTFLTMLGIIIGIASVVAGRRAGQRLAGAHSQ